LSHPRIGIEIDGALTDISGVQSDFWCTVEGFMIMMVGKSGVFTTEREVGLFFEENAGALAEFAYQNSELEFFKAFALSAFNGDMTQESFDGLSRLYI
jgi:hypothetical protein